MQFINFYVSGAMTVFKVYSIMTLHPSDIKQCYAFATAQPMRIMLKVENSHINILWVHGF
jgi:hypothetical protein